MIKHITDDDFTKEVLESNLPVLVDFWAPWCAPCLMAAPVIEEIAKDYAGKVKVAKLNVDENQETPGKYGIMSIPTMYVFKNGEVAEQIVGYVPKDYIRGKIEAVLKM